MAIQQLDIEQELVFVLVELGSVAKPAAKVEHTVTTVQALDLLDTEQVSALVVDNVVVWIRRPPTGLVEVENFAARVEYIAPVVQAIQSLDI